MEEDSQQYKFFTVSNFGVRKFLIDVKNDALVIANKI